MVSNKNPTLQWRALHFILGPAGCNDIYLNHSLCCSMVTQLQKLWILCRPNLL